MVTGGEYSMRNVSRYNSLGGYVEDLAELINGRFGHACGSYFDSNNQMVNFLAF